MKESFVPETVVRFKLRDGSLGSLAKISNYKKTSDWKIPGYLGEDFYYIITIPDQRHLIVHEDDLVKI